jgi:prophage regulatory protein
MSESSTAQAALGYLRIWDIIGDRKRGINPLIPVGRTTWLNGVKEGKYPKPIKLSDRVTVWKRSDILKLLETMGKAA